MQTLQRRKKRVLGTGKAPGHQGDRGQDAHGGGSRWLRLEQKQVEGVGFEIQHTLGLRREEDQAEPLRLVDFGFYFKWMGTLLVHFWPGE